jgi:hypothetical protein
VLRVRDGQVTGWREYQDAVAIAHALGQLPALPASISESHAWPAGCGRGWRAAARGRRRVRAGCGRLQVVAGLLA